MNDSKNGILITNIQRFSLHDGPGIRTTVFTKGCSLRCPWCSNPENLIPSPQEYVKDGVKGVYGKWYTADELVTECLRDKGFYDGKLPEGSYQIDSAGDIELLPGGVTFSGGECLLQIKELIPVCEKLHECGIHIAAETCLFVPKSMLECAIANIDLFYADVKILNDERCRETLKGYLGQFLENYETLIRSGKPVIARIPVIGGQTDDEDNRGAVKELLKRNRPLKIELLREHNLGESKYKSLGMAAWYQGVSDDLMEQYKEELSDLGIPTEICRI